MNVTLKVCAIMEIRPNIFIKNVEENKVNNCLSNAKRFNQSIMIKKSFKYLPHIDFHKGIDSTGILNGKMQIENNILFILIQKMPKGSLHHAHLYALTDILF